MFVYKSQEEIDKMDSATYETYVAEKNAHEADLRKKEIEKAIEEAQKNNASKEELEKLTNKNAEIVKEIERLSLELKKAGENAKTDRTAKNFSEELAMQFEANKELIGKVANKEVEKASIVIKSPVTVGVNNTILAEGSASHVSVTSMTGIVSALRKRVLRYLQNVSVGRLSVDKPYAQWFEELDEQGAPIFLGEGALKQQASVRYEEREKKAVKIAVYGKVTEEMLRYLPRLVTFFQNNLMRRMEIKMEDELFAGLGGANQLSGLIGYATVFNGGGLTTADPSDADVFRALALQVEKAFGQANAVFVRPEILAQMDVEKTTDGFYLLPPFRATNGNMVAGMELIPSLGLPNGVDFVGGDLSVVNVEFTDQIRVEFDRTGDDMIYNRRTVLIEAELVQFVSANDTQLLVKGAMATAKATITAS